MSDDSEVTNRDFRNSLDKGTTLSSFVVSRHLSTARPCLTGNACFRSRNWTLCPSVHAFLSIRGCVLNCRSLPNASECDRDTITFEASADATRRSKSPFSSSESNPPSLFKASESFSRTTRCTLSWESVSDRGTLYEGCDALLFVYWPEWIFGFCRCGSCSRC